VCVGEEKKKGKMRERERERDRERERIEEREKGVVLWVWVKKRQCEWKKHKKIGSITVHSDLSFFLQSAKIFLKRCSRLNRSWECEGKRGKRGSGRTMKK
jgi:hypothetical protein